MNPGQEAALPSRTRRELLRMALSGAAGVALGPGVLGVATAQAQAPVGATALSDSLHLLTVEPINVLARTGPEGVVLVDGGPAASRSALLEAIAELPGSGAIATLFNTHWHPEQTGLNEHVGTTGGAIIAQENTRLWLSTDITYPWDGSRFEPLPEVAQPNKTFYDDGELDSGVRYGYLRHAAHTDGDLYVQFLDENVLAVGDTVCGSGWPFVDWWTGGWIGGIVGNLELLLSLSDAETRIVPARGPVVRRADLEGQYGMYNVIYERLARMLNAGRGPDEVVAARPTVEFDAEMGPPDEFVRRAFESLWAYLSPDA
jgi:glyoxylase-like metal-dependent hydrolase (beta-lactamase superfamily II)